MAMVKLMSMRWTWAGEDDTREYNHNMVDRIKFGNERTLTVLLLRPDLMSAAESG